MKIESVYTTVLKYRFYYYLGMARSPDQKITTIEKVVCFVHRSQGRGHVLPCRATWGSTGVGQEAEGKRKEMWARALTMVSVESNRRGGVGGFRIG